MAVNLFSAGLELFRRSQMAIFDKALSLVDLFDSAVSESVYAMQEIYPDSFYYVEQKEATWENLLATLMAGFFRHMRLFAIFTLALLCFTVMVFRQRGRNGALGQIPKIPNPLPNLQRPRRIKPSRLCVSNKYATFNDRYILDDKSSGKKPMVNVDKSEVSKSEVSKGFQNASPDGRSVSPQIMKGVNNPRDNGKSQTTETHESKMVQEEMPPTLTLSDNVTVTDLKDPTLRIYRRLSKKTSQSRSLRTAKIKENRIIQRKTTQGKNKAQVFILLDDREKDTVHSSKTVPQSPPPVTISSTKPKYSHRRSASPYKLQKIPSLRERKPFKGGGPLSESTDARPVSDRQKQKADIPYLHTISPKRRLPPKPVHNHKDNKDNKKQKPTGSEFNPLSGIYVSPKSRRAETSKVNWKSSKRVSASSNKRCKTCKKIRQPLEEALTPVLLPISKRGNIGSLFCFSPRSQLPAPFRYAKINANADNAHYKTPGQSNNKLDESRSCAADTNMNKAVFKFELQNNNPNNHTVNDLRYTIRENLPFSKPSTNCERLREEVGQNNDLKRQPNFLPYRIQHNVYPTNTNETHTNANKYMHCVVSQVYDNQEGIKRRGNNSVDFRQSRTKERHRESKLCSNGHSTHVQAIEQRQPDLYRKEKSSYNLFSLSHLKSAHEKETRINDAQNSSLHSGSCSTFQSNYQCRYKSLHHRGLVYKGKCHSSRRYLKDERLRKCQKQKKEHIRESKRRYTSEISSSKQSNPFISRTERVEEYPFTSANIPMPLKAYQDADLGINSCNKLDSSVADKSSKITNRHCDKIKSFKWRHRHEPYKCAPFRTHSSRTVSIDDDLSHATFTLNTSSSETMNSCSKNKRYRQDNISKIKDLTKLAQYTGSTENSKDLSSNEADTYTYSIKSASSYENKNNCSPSRPTKPVTKTNSEIIENETIESLSVSVAGGEQLMETKLQGVGCKVPFSSGSIKKMSNDQSPRTKLYPVQSALGGAYNLLESDHSSNEGFHRQKRRSSSKSRYGKLFQRSRKYSVGQLSDTKLESERKASVAMQQSCHRTRNKVLRQQKLYKHPFISRKVSMRTIKQHSPTESSPDIRTPPVHSITLGVQTSRTSLRHIAVQTSPQEMQAPARRIPVRVGHNNTNVRIKNVERPHSQEQRVDVSPAQIYFGNSPKESKVHSSDVSRTLGKTRTFIEEEETETHGSAAATGNKSEKENPFNAPYQSSFINENTLDAKVTTETKFDKSGVSKPTNPASDEALKSRTVPIRHQTMSMISLSSSHSDHKNEMVVSQNCGGNISSNLSTSTSKDWLARPKWENANEDEVNRRVERALKLRQELQMCRSKTQTSPHKTNASLRIKSKTEHERDFRAQKMQTVVAKQNIPSALADVALENTPNPNTESNIQSMHGSLLIRNQESSTTDTLIKTFPFVVGKAESMVLGNTYTEDTVYKEATDTKVGSTEETDSTTDTPEQYQSFPIAGAGAVPDSTEVRPSSATSLSQNITDNIRREEKHEGIQGNSRHHLHQHRRHAPPIKNSPPIKISKIENVIQTEYPKLVGELVQALPHVPLASFVEWFIETSNPGHVFSSDESNSTAADAKELATDGVSTHSAMESSGNDPSVIFVRQEGPEEVYDDHRNSRRNENRARDKTIPSFSEKSSDNVFNMRVAYKSILPNNTRHHVKQTDTATGKSSTGDDDILGDDNIASIKRILLTRKTTSEEGSESPADNNGRIISLRQASNGSSFEGNSTIPSQQ